MTSLSQLSTALAGRYEIEREIGRGGMATVYLARDVKHHRRVALKVLAPELGAVLGAERFLSEIRVTANLQHPNLLPLFDSGEVDGLLYYVMPYVEGETLRARLAREKQLPVDEAVHIAMAIASALGYAHRHGVIHRDLKPENILLHEGQPLVADFGIALAVSNAGGERVTQTGLSLGTPQYMSPEQATGDRSIDGRTDIYSLGAITYEMLAGEPPHLGTSAQAIIAKLMTEEPRPLTMLRRSVPAHVDDAVECALEKLPADRFPVADDFAMALRGGSPTRTHRARASAARTRRSSRMLVGALAGVSALALVLAALLARSSSRPAPPATRFSLDLPPGQRIPLPEGSAVTLSPDGRIVAYVAETPGAASRGIYVRPLDSLRGRPLAGAELGHTPRFSADGRWVAFKTPSDIRKVPLGGGGAEVLAPVTDWQNFAWGPKGEIIVARRGSLWRVDPKGMWTPFTSPDTARGEIGHAGPWFLNDETVAFWAQKPSADGTIRGIGITSAAGGDYTVLDIPGDMPLGYAHGHLFVSNQNGSLLAYPVDLRRRRVTGPPTPLVDSVVWIAPGGQQVNLARDGSLVYLRGSSGRRLAVIDARGVMVAETPELRDYQDAAIAPDGRRVAVAVSRSIVGGRNPAFTDIWIWDLESNGLVRVTTGGGTSPEWSGDGRTIAFVRYWGRTSESAWARSEAWLAGTDGNGPEQRVPFPASTRVMGVRLAPTGGAAVIVANDRVTSDDLYLVNLANPDSAPVPIARTRFREHQPRISPDGRWLAFTSDETGRDEIYVQPLGGTAARLRVSNGGARLAQWASKGTRLVYATESGRTVAATVSVSGSSIGVARQDTILIGEGGARIDIDAHTDRTLVAREPDDRRIIVVSNWLTEVKAKLRAP
jgi:serine/threonine protein kinase/dipeptidyl aminopeptidase/acylaminoacyl peptidase